jgi:predicted permease
VLALGIGVVSGAFNLVNVLSLKPMLIEEPEEVLGVFAVHPIARTPDDPRARYFSYPEYVQIRERIETLSSLAAWDFDIVGVEEGDVTRRTMIAFVSADYFETLGVPLAQGRGFTLAEERGEEPATVVVSHDFWVRNGARRDLLGSVVRVNGEALVVVGIAARGFTGATALFAPDVWVPLASMERVQAREGGEAPNLRDPRHTSLLLFGRLEDGTSAAEAESELAALAARIDANVPRDETPYTYIVAPMTRISITPEPNTDASIIGPMLVPMAMSAVVLAVACLNLANMFLARGASRRTEMAIRQSLGSGRARLIRQLLSEGLLLAMLGGAVGLIWSYWGTSWIAASLARVLPLDMRIVLDTRPDVRVLLTTAATCIAATLLFGLGPAWRVTGTDVLSGLKEGAGAVTFHRRRARVLLSGRSLLIVAQIALSLAMLTAGGLFMRGALVAANATPGFSLDSSLLVELDPSLAGYDEIRSRDAYAQVIERLRALPEVENAGMASLVPFSGTRRDEGVQRAGLPPGESVSNPLYSVISDDYFDSLRLPLLRGRDFTPSEATSATAPRVAIIDEPLARLLFPDSDALGRQIQLASSNPDAESIVMEIVGIAPGIAGDQFDPEPRPHVYVPFGQAYTPNMYVHIAVSERVADEARLLETIRNEIRGVDPSLPVLSLTTMRVFLDENVFLWFIRIGGRLFTLLGALALFMAMVGLYGVKAFLMSRRTREIGVRMALGATRGAMLREMMRESMAVTAVGLAVGLVLALAVGRILSSLLYEVSATDPWAFLGATAFLALAATVASWLPIERALRVQPSAALRHE